MRFHELHAVIESAALPRHVRPWLTGRCYDFALALSERLPDADFVGIGGSAKHPEHVGLRANGRYYDARGATGEDEFRAHHVGPITVIPRDIVELNAGVAGMAPPYSGNRDIAEARRAVRLIYGTNTLTEARHPMQFYHGTSSKVLPAILEHGLTPQSEPVSAMRGNGSTIPGYTERMVFLAPLAGEAMFYAQELCHTIGGDPVLLTVELSPTDPLRVSDDYIVNVVIRAIMAHQGHPPLTADDFDEDGDLDVSISQTAETYSDWADFLAEHRDAFYAGKLDQIADTDAIRTALEAGYAAFQRAVKAPWQASVRTGQRDPAVAYEGVIAPERLRVMTAAQVRSAALAHKRHRRSTNFTEAAARKIPRLLYHGAPLGAIIGMVEIDFISAEHGFISFTTNYAIAKSFAHDEDPNYGGVLVFDGEALNRLGYNQIKPYRDPILADPEMRVSGFKTESEWRSRHDILHMSQALLSINVDPAVLQEAKADSNWLKSDEYLRGAPISPKEARLAIDKILRSPLLNKMVK